MMLRLILPLLVVASLAHAQTMDVARITAPQTIVVRVPAGAAIKIGNRVAFRGQKDDHVLGWGIVRSLSGGGEAVVDLRLHAQNQLVMVGDRVEVVHLDRKDPRFPGRSDLLQKAHEVDSARYKPLAWSGPFFPNGHTIDQGEVLIDPIMFQVGITEDITMFTQPILAAGGLYGGGIKFRLFDNDVFQFTPFVTVYYAPKAVGARGSVVPSGVLTLYSNSKFMSHLEGQVSIGFARSDRVVADDEEEIGLRRGVATSIRSASEYIFDNWDRLQFGPTYNFDLDSFGGVIGYLMVFDHFHFGVALRTVDFTNLKLDFIEGYAPWVTFFWRI